MLRPLYLWMIRLHPRYFRQRFGEEMVEIFEEVSGARAVASLFADAFVSLFRQWALRSEFRQPMLASPETSIFRTFDTYKPRPAVLLNGCLVSAALLFAVVLTMGHGGSPRRAFLIGVYHPSPRLVPLDRSSFTKDELNTVVKFEREPADPWRAIASIYFKLVRVLGALDADQDLIISPWEIAGAPAVLRRLDKDHDGKLSPEECGFSLSANPEIVFDPEFVKRARLDFMRVNPVLAALDANHDGEISELEIARSPAALKTLDKNGDGSLTPDEVLPDKAANQAALIISRLDTNRDGRISGAELDSEEARPLRDLLESADRNHDGTITAEQLTKELRLRQEQRKQFENATRTGGFGRSSRTEHLP
jgi:Ca2+-binding EF-hand superfamily protein